MVVAMRVQENGKPGVVDVATGQTYWDAVDGLRKQTDLACVEIWSTRGDGEGTCDYIDTAEGALIGAELAAEAAAGL